MKKPVKIALISLGSLLAVLVIAVAVVCNIVFSSERLTKLVRQHAGDFITCQTDIGDVDLTVFGNFPKVSLRISDLALINPMEGAQSDTLLSVRTLFAELDVMDYLNNDRVTVTGFILHDAVANVFISADSLTNFDIVRASADEAETDTTSAAMSFDQLSLQNISVDNLSASFVDQTSGMTSQISGLAMKLRSDASLQTLSGGADVELCLAEFVYADSLNHGRISGLELSPSHLYYDGRNATAVIPALVVAAQNYSLDGEAPLEADVWGMKLDGFDVKWQDERPTLIGVTRIDSSAIVIGGANRMCATTHLVEFDLPVVSTAETWTTKGRTLVRQLCLDMAPDGTMVRDMDIESSFTASTSSQFNNFYVTDMLTTAGGQTVSGDVHVDMTDTTVIRADVDVHVRATTVAELLTLVPKAYVGALKGLTVNARLDDSHITASCEVRDNGFKLGKTNIQSGIHTLDYIDDTSLGASFDDLTVDVTYPAGSKGHQFAATSVLRGLKVGQHNDSTSLDAAVPALTFTALIQDDVIDGKDPRLSASFDGSLITACLDDTLSVEVHAPKGHVDIDMKSVRNCIKIALDASVGKIVAGMGKTLNGTTGRLDLRLDALYDEHQADVLDQLSPEAVFTMTDAHFDVDGIPYPVLIPSVNATFNKDKAVLKSCQLNLGNSDLGLDGVISNINAWLKQQTLLDGQLNLKSRHVDADQLMELASGFGADSAVVAADVAEVAESSASSDTLASPFMVPKDVRFVVNTNVAEVAVNGNTFENVGGQITCDDGVLVLEEMGFTSRAAKMQLTALYKSPRENNLFVGWNFHLLDIDIAEMIRLVPEIDTIVPMLSAFQGKAEFHLTGESSLFRDYSPKMSTLKAVAAIEGKDLTVLDSETFQTIKKYLFKESTSNRIDTLSVEMSLARKKMTLYPMLVGWDKYEAVISGTHTVVDAMPFSYHISITKCPLVGGHLGLDITGDLDDVDHISFSLGNCKYANLYRPEKRNLTQQQTLELKELISSSLKRTVK